MGSAGPKTLPWAIGAPKTHCISVLPTYADLTASARNSSYTDKTGTVSSKYRQNLLLKSCSTFLPEIWVLLVQEQRRHTALWPTSCTPELCNSSYKNISTDVSSLCKHCQGFPPITSCIFFWGYVGFEEESLFFSVKALKSSALKWSSHQFPLAKINKNIPVSFWIFSITLPQTNYNTWNYHSSW